MSGLQQSFANFWGFLCVRARELDVGLSTIILSDCANTIQLQPKAVSRSVTRPLICPTLLRGNNCC